MSDARMEVALAEQVEAPTFASREMDEARMLLSQADRFLKEGDEKQAKRLAERALLTARYARTLASYRKLKRKLDKEEIELQTLQRELEAARVKREAAEAELRRLRGKEAER
jgi:DNA repair exonuclease SbcCD ATPase subunit